MSMSHQSRHNSQQQSDCGDDRRHRHSEQGKLARFSGINCQPKL